MLSAKAALEDRLEGLQLRADDCPAKPFNRIHGANSPPQMFHLQLNQIL